MRTSAFYKDLGNGPHWRATLSRPSNIKGRSRVTADICEPTRPDILSHIKESAADGWSLACGPYLWTPNP